jgi:DNA repair photolyase
MAIISASRRSDIPAFFAHWFMERVRQGFFHRVNPFNPRQVKAISLRPEDVDAIVFWTKNPKPLFPFLAELDDRGLNYYVQFTLNPYHQVFEPNLPPLSERIHTFRALGEMIGPRRLVWRYDPLILSSRTPLEYHREMFGCMATELHGASKRVMFSFLDFYGKARGRLRGIQQEQGVVIQDIRGEEFRNGRWELLRGMRACAAENGMELYSCAEAEDLERIGIRHGHCIDGGLLRELFGVSTTFARDRRQRKECGCAQSVDMGAYNSCPFQCAYCYANASPKAIATNLKRHDPTGSALIGDYPVERSAVTPAEETEGGQHSLF